MGIYSDGNVYGVCWNIYDISEKLVKNFEKTYPKKMNLDQIQYIETEYNKLNEIERNSAKFGFHTCCSSTYDTGTFMSWFPVNKDSFDKFLLNGDIRI